MKVLVTGAEGQLGRCIKEIYNKSILDDEYVFANKYDFNITKPYLMEKYIQEHGNIDCIINCAAYTNVERCEDDKYTAFYVNSFGVKNLVDICEKYDIRLFHISTDYVYDINVDTPSENSEINPPNIYGQSKRDGEIHIEKSNLNKWYIFRTSWLYSPYGNNFFTKIIDKIFNTQDKIYIISNEVGSPTCAYELATFIMGLIQLHMYEDIPNGIYNFSDDWTISRYQFACLIADYVKPSRRYSIVPISQAKYNQDFKIKAKRSNYCVLKNYKINSYPFYTRSNPTDLVNYCAKKYLNK